MGKRFRRIAAVSIIGVVIAGGAGTAYAALSSAGPVYRLARVTSANETAALHTVGTLTPARQADVAFTVSGTVAAVRVRPGQHVTAGQELGSLDTTPLKAQLTMAQSDLARANLQADQDEASQNTAAPGSASSAGPQPAPSLRPLQQAVLTAQRKADLDLARARTALGQARRACTAPPPSPSPSPSRSPSSSPGSSSSPSLNSSSNSSPSAVPPAPASPALSCADATQRVLSAETAVLQAQRELSGQLTALDQALSKAVAAASKSSAGGHGSSTVGGGSAHGGGSGGSPASAVQLAADQASADAAAAQVTVAQQNLAAATVVSPISGTVVTVGVTTGSSAAAGSTAFVVAGLDRYQVVTEVAVDDMPELRAGQQASVLPDGMSTPISGSVISIGLVPDTSGSPATYPVTIGLTDPPAGLHAGSFADVTIITGRASGVSVPTSAVHYSGRSGRLATVTVYAGGRARVVRVTVGTKGPVMTRITAGLRIGQQVVLADLSKPLPTDNQFSGRGGGPPFGGSVQVIGPG